MYLAGRLLHRSAQSECEREAAVFIKGRLKEYTPDVTLEPFHSAENYPYLFASYLSEFLIVGMISFIWPQVAFGYGTGVFLLYLAEFIGYRGLSRFLPQFPSQNVVGRFLGLQPKSTIIVTAYYDSGCAMPFTTPERVAWLRPVHVLLVSCMVVVLATCAADSFSDPEMQPNQLSAIVRWSGIGVLAFGALILFFTASHGDDIRGANNNASGVAALLGLAEKLKAEPAEDADVWLVATGSHEAWMGGIRHFLAEHKPSRANTYFLNLESVGAGRLHYLTKEGFLYALPADPTMVALAKSMCAGRPIQAGTLRAVPTEAHALLSRNRKAMTLMGLDRGGLPRHWNQISDRVTEVDTTNIAETIDFAAGYVRKLARQHADPGALNP